MNCSIDYDKFYVQVLIMGKFAHVGIEVLNTCNTKYIFIILQPEDKGADSSVADMKSLISTLQQFMEGSSLGEYTTRLDMIQAFHYQLVQMDPSSRQGIFWV